MRILPSRFNPVGGIADFWNEIRRPQPYRWPILGLSILPVALALYWGATGTTVYAEPERPKIEYITTLDPTRTDAEIAAENRANQEINELRKAEEARIAERKRDLYKALGAASGMDVEAIEAKAEAERKAAAERETKAKGAEVAAANRPGEGTAQ
ncbi:hypothetical protein [Erythrobacter donghaensis]|uniref:hypothetical protein n=1 Tax=Erythrobacter donghaensis TaxID=267135 RepID=UPI000A3A3256|nr:hypothetical protein [Erythrobacter donghaensis]